MSEQFAICLLGLGFFLGWKSTKKLTDSPEKSQDIWYCGIAVAWISIFCGVYLFLQGLS